MDRTSRHTRGDRTSVQARPERIRRLAERLRHDLAQVLAGVPAERHGVTRLSEWTGVPKPVCFRVLDAARPGAEPLEIINALPGIRGLEQTLNAIANNVRNRSVRTSAARSVQTYRELLDLLGGTQAKAKRTAAALLKGAGGPGEELSARKAAFESARGITGVWSDALVIAQSVSPRAQGESLYTTTMVTGHVGLRGGHANLPVVFLWRNPQQVERAFRSLEAQRPHGLNLYALLPEFSTDPFPKIITQGEPGFERDVIDWDEAGSNGPVNVFTGIRGSEPPTPGPLESHVVVRVPTRRLVIDLLLPWELDLTGPASGAAYFIGIGGTVRGEQASRWHDRLHDLSPPFDSMDPSGPAAEPAFDRHEELLDHMLATSGATRDQFRRLRWTIRFPLWGADYSLRVFPKDGGASG